MTVFNVNNDLRVTHKVYTTSDVVGEFCSAIVFLHQPAKNCLARRKINETVKRVLKESLSSEHGTSVARP